MSPGVSMLSTNREIKYKIKLNRQFVLDKFVKKGYRGLNRNGVCFSLPRLIKCLIRQNF